MSETTPLKTLTVQVVPNAKVQKLVVQKEGLKVWVNAPAHDGQANRAVIDQLVRHLNLKKTKCNWSVAKNLEPSSSPSFPKEVKPEIPYI